MSHTKRDEMSAALLGWYDVHARPLPWRSPPGRAPPDPYRVWLSEIMLQQTTVTAVKPYFARFVERWPDVMALAEADDAEVMSAWAGLGYYARARHLLACARVVAREHDGRFPETEAALLRLPGIGRYTAAAITAIAFGARAVVVDGNVERVVARLFAVEATLPAVKPELYRLTDAIAPEARAGDFAQAMMDLGSGICTPKRPACAICPLREFCVAVTTGAPERFPLRAAKPPRPTRFGTVFWLERDGDVLLVTRPANGLLGGMRALPTGPWSFAAPLLDDPPIAGAWRLNGAGVRHVFTHFALELAIARLTLEKGCAAQLAGEWWRIDRLAEAGLPSVFAKAAAAAMESPREN